MAMPRKKLVIFPCNGNGIEALDCLNSAEFEFIGFIDDDPTKKSDQYEVFRREFLNQHQEIYLLAVPGSPSSFRFRKEVIESLGVDSKRFVTVVHPKATIGKNVSIGRNCLIMAGVVLTSNAKLKDHVCVLPNTVIHHDVLVEDYTILGSNVVVAGGTKIGSYCYIGSGTNIINNVIIGESSLIGLGANVIKSIPSNSRSVGNPARSLSGIS